MAIKKRLGKAHKHLIGKPTPDSSKIHLAKRKGKRNAKKA